MKKTAFTILLLALLGMILLGCSATGNVVDETNTQPVKDTPVGVKEEPKRDPASGTKAEKSEDGKLCASVDCKCTNILRGIQDCSGGSSVSPKACRSNYEWITEAKLCLDDALGEVCEKACEKEKDLAKHIPEDPFGASCNRAAQSKCKEFHPNNPGLSSTSTIQSHQSGWV